MASSTINLVTLMLASVLLLTLASGQSIHVVGGTNGGGWRVPENTNSYATWASSQRFKVGDTLVFNFMTDTHTVAQVTKENYDSCNSASTVGPIRTTGPASIVLNSTGDFFFICTVGQHCSSGQKLSINVVSSSSTPSVRRSPATSGTGASSPSPSPSSSTPSGSPQNSFASSIYLSLLVLIFPVAMPFYF